MVVVVVVVVVVDVYPYFKKKFHPYFFSFCLSLIFVVDLVLSLRVFLCLPI